MRLLFISLLDFSSFNERNIYTDLLREFIKNGHDVYCISPVERRKKVNTHMEESGHLLKLKIGNTQKTNIIEKGISTLLIEPLFKQAIKKYFSNIKFDLILYTTPPITVVNVVKYVKQRDEAFAYLMLKDIFPQNAVDLGMMSKKGFKGLLYRYFRNKEKKLYEISDKIGCMSQANIEYVLNNNPEITGDKVELCPNCIDIQDINVSNKEKEELRKKYGIPLEKKVFVYGGNLSKPQGIDFLIECIRLQNTNEDIFFLIVGSGTEYYKLESFFLKENPKNLKLMKSLPKDEYDKMIAACDVGMVILDYRFTVPNFPSRLLAYMQAGLPVLACTDKNTDIGQCIIEGKFGWWCESNNADEFSCCIKKAIDCDKDTLGMYSRVYLKNKFRSDIVYHMILKNSRVD